jgi:hypothetical protein
MGRHKGHLVSTETRQKIRTALLGHFVSPEARAKMSKSRMGLPSGNKGKHFHHTEEAKKKISLAGMGRTFSEERKRKIGDWFRGKPLSEEHKKKLSESHKGQSGKNSSFYGHHHSEEARKKMRSAKIGTKIPEETKKKMSLAHKGKANLLIRGEKSHFWKGGISFFPYPREWNALLKQKIMERDGNRCRNPGCRRIPGRLTVHHIDYNKMNCDPANLITLCVSCNGRANKNRQLYTAFYKILREAICLKQKWNTKKI